MKMLNLWQIKQVYLYIYIYMTDVVGTTSVALQCYALVDYFPNGLYVW